jgi:hypothetical protein
MSLLSIVSAFFSKTRAISSLRPSLVSRCLYIMYCGWQNPGLKLWIVMYWQGSEWTFWINSEEQPNERRTPHVHATDQRTIDFFHALFWQTLSAGCAERLHGVPSRRFRSGSWTTCRCSANLIPQRDAIHALPMFLKCEISIHDIFVSMRICRCCQNLMIVPFFPLRRPGRVDLEESNKMD